MNTITHVQGSDDGRMLSSGSGRFNLYPLPSRFELRTSSFHCRNEDGVSRRKSSGFFSKSRSILVSIRNRHRNDRFPSGKSLSSGSYDIENGNVAYPGAVSDCISYMRSCG
ncbi:hypothetical protein KP509_05G053100 [Ceratopteris richardii]|nr:hypothetical protein KP509_05G053100 [Ceratopteris richardii]